MTQIPKEPGRRTTAADPTGATSQVAGAWRVPRDCLTLAVVALVLVAAFLA